MAVIVDDFSGFRDHGGEWELFAPPDRAMPQTTYCVTVHLEIDRSDIRTRRMVGTAAPDAVADGTVVLALETFALTANNVSYAHSGDFLDYWGFFPTETGWGRLPVMGFGRVTHSAVDGIEVGSRYFGFYPAADHHVVTAAPSRSGFVDAGVHREPHAMAYRTFDRADASLTPDDEDRYLLLRGLLTGPTTTITKSAKTTNTKGVVVVGLGAFEELPQNLVVPTGRQFEAFLDERLFGASFVPPTALEIEDCAVAFCEFHRR